MKFYSRDELLPEIVGKDIYEMSPGAVKQAIYRFDKVLKKMGSYRDKRGIPESKKNQYVNLMNGIYFNDKIKKIINKIYAGNKVLEEEHIYLFDFLLEGIEDETERNLYEYHRRELLGKELNEQINSIYMTNNKFSKNNICLPYEIQIELLKDINIEINNYIAKNQYKIDLLKSLPTSEELVYGFAEEMKCKYDEK